MKNKIRKSAEKFALRVMEKQMKQLQSKVQNEENYLVEALVKFHEQQLMKFKIEAIQLLKCGCQEIINLKLTGTTISVGGNIFLDEVDKFILENN